MSQHRLSRVQLVNWGTFDGSRSFNVPRRGLLLTGPSGAGKSSILDAIASLLVRPGKLKFNAAAQGTETGDRERSLVTYVLGAFKRETDAVTGEVGTAFLRRSPTWSGVALTFDDGRGTATTLIRLFHLRAGATSPTDLRSMYIMAPGNVDLLTLQPYAKDGIENRRVQQAFPGWDCFSGDGYTGFSARFRRRLGLGSEQAQLLLHKTQSAKNLTNLDSLFRDFMLDEPDTFDLARDTVEQFDELTLAHAAVVDARHQVDMLLPLREHGAQHAEAVSALTGLESEEAHLATWLSARDLQETQASLDRERPRLAVLGDELTAAEHQWDAADARRIQAQRALDGSGGAQLGTLEELISTLHGQLARAEARVEAFAQKAESVQVAWPESASDRELFVTDLNERISRFEAEQHDHQTQIYAALDQRRVLRERVEGIEGELAALRRYGSNLDPRLLAARQLLVERLQVDVATLPFVGELLQVRAEDAVWTGAIERVLASFARTLVVPERHYLAASEIVDAQFLGARLVYEKVSGTPAVEVASEPSPASLVAKLEPAEGLYQGWVMERLHRRFDYACVDHPRDFRRHDRAVTRAGQVKHSSSLHEKDDRRQVDERSRWVLGFSTVAKEAELERQLTDAHAAAIEASRAVEELGRGDADRQSRRAVLAELERLDWSELDTALVRQQLRTNQDTLDQLRRDNRDVPQLELALTTARGLVDDAESVRRRLAHQRDAASETVARLESRTDALRAALAAALPIPTQIAEQLETRASALDVRPERLEVELQRLLANRRRRSEQSREDAARRITRLMGRYRQEWPAQSADWADEVAYLPEYLERLSTLERDGLPTFEQRFFELLQSQTNRNIGQLALKIKSARREIRTRVDEVNKSLRLTEFTPGGCLQIDVRDRGLDDVDQFLATLNDITSGSMTDVFTSENPEERAIAERRFTLMKGVLDRLGSSDPADRAWRERCLDTRQHVQFQARVQDDAGTQLDVFTGSGGRSGGERQKLVTFCLAAALRFQLAPAGHTEPTYALVVIDEAFDKADHEFTRAGLEVFKKFGFQLLLATPMKMLQTIDDYVGGVVMVTNDSGRRSQVQELPFETDEDADDSDSTILQESLL